MKRIITLLLTIMLIASSSVSVFAGKRVDVAKIGETEYSSLQEAFDDATDEDTIEIYEGNYETVYLQNSTSGPNRIMKDITIKPIDGAQVSIEQIAYKRIDGKSLDIENLTIDGITFTNPDKSAVLFDVDSGRSIRVNGLTIQNCSKTGNKSQGTQYDNAAFIGLYYDGAMDIGTVYAGDATLTCGYHDIKILNNTITSLFQPIKVPNDGPLYGLTVSGNTFTDCLDNHMMLSSKTTGIITVSDNTLVNMTGRFARISGAQSGATFVISGNDVITPLQFDTGGDGDIVKITGSTGFTVSQSGNEWADGKYTDSNNTKWIAMGEYVAKINDVKYSTLKDAISDVKNNEIIKLAKDIVATGWIEINKPSIAFTIDLNGHKIERSDGSLFDIYSKVTIMDSSTSGTIKAKGRALYCNEGADLTLESGTIIGTDGNVINVIGDYGSAKKPSKFTMNGGNVSGAEGVNLQAEEYGAEFIMNGGSITSDDCGITYYGNNTKDAAKITINAGTIKANGEAAICGNGSKSGANVNIESGNFTNESGAAIYTPEFGELTINGGTFTGTQGIVVKSGKVTINDGTFIANGNFNNPSEPANSGYTLTGDAIYVEDDYYESDYTFKHKIELIINDGTFTSANNHALAAGFTKAGKTAAIININNGKFMSANDIDSIKAMNSFSGTIAVNGGVFSTKVAEELIVDDTVTPIDYTSVVNNDSSTCVKYPWTIGKRTIELPEQEKVDSKQVSNKTPSYNEQPTKHEVIDKIRFSSVDLAPEAATLAASKNVFSQSLITKAETKTDFTGAENEELNIEVRTFLDIEVTNVNKQEGQDNIQNFKADITPKYIVTAYKSVSGQDKETYEIASERIVNVDRSILVRVYLPDNFKSSNPENDRVWVRHYLKDGSAKVYGGDNGFEIKSDSTGRYVEFENPDGFSEFEFFLEKVNPIEVTTTSRHRYNIVNTGVK